MQSRLWRLVDSSVLAAVAFHRHVLTVRFHSGKTYSYLGVPAPLYRQLLAAESKGSFFNAYIRNTFPHQPAHKTK
jgi:lysyl-tRNA synthetase class 2